MAFGTPRRRRLDEDQRILPLINVVFLLLIFFMVAGQLANTDPVPIEPPVSNSDKETANRTLQILVPADGRILIEGKIVQPADLRARLKALAANDAARSIHLKSDGATEARIVIRILDQIKDAGFEKVKLLTNPRPRQ